MKIRVVLCLVLGWGLSASAQTLVTNSLNLNQNIILNHPILITNLVAQTNEVAVSTNEVAVLYTNISTVYSSNCVDPGGVLPNFDSACLPPSEDNPSTNVPVGFRFRFGGVTYDSVWINNDGTVTLDGPFGGHNVPSFEPLQPLSALGRVIFAPFWADIDTLASSGSGSVCWGTNYVCVEGRIRTAFGVTWNNVGYFPDSGQNSDKTNSFQLLIIDIDSPLAYLEFRYGSMNWDTASSCHGTKGLCIQLPNGEALGIPARAGYAEGTNSSYEMPGSGQCNGAMLDSSGSSALIKGQLNSATNGVYLWQLP